MAFGFKGGKQSGQEITRQEKFIPTSTETLVIHIKYWIPFLRSIRTKKGFSLELIQTRLLTG